MRMPALSLAVVALCSFASKAQPAEPASPPAERKAFDFNVYGRVNVSFDVGNQGLKDVVCTATGPCPHGNLRWLPDVASNLSRLGVRGYHDLAGKDYQAVFQI